MCPILSTQVFVEALADWYLVCVCVYPRACFIMSVVYIFLSALPHAFEDFFFLVDLSSGLEFVFIFSPFVYGPRRITTFRGSAPWDIASYVIVATRHTALTGRSIRRRPSIVRPDRDGQSLTPARLGALTTRDS